MWKSFTYSGLIMTTVLVLTGCGSYTSSSETAPNPDSPVKIKIFLSILIDGPKAKNSAVKDNYCGDIDHNYSDLVSSEKGPNVTLSNLSGDTLASYPFAGVQAIETTSLSDFSYVLPKSKCVIKQISFEVTKESAYQIQVAQRDPVTISQKDFITKWFPADAFHAARYITAMNVYFSKDAPNGLWFPPTYILYDDGSNNIAWRWNNSIISNCYSDSCIGMQVITNPDESGCPGGLYVELNQKDASGAVTGITNETVGSLSPGDKANLTFQLDSGSNSASLSSLDCHP